jgi:hypothetical protein
LLLTSLISQLKNLIDHRLTLVTLLAGHLVPEKFLSLVKTHPVMAAMLLTVFCRLAIFFGSMIWPIPNENLAPVSPLSVQGYLDFQFYLKSLEQYKNLPLSEIFSKFVAFYQRPFQEQFGHIIAGPVFPAIIGLFDYRTGNTLPLSIAFLMLDCIWSGFWIKWGANKGVPVLGLIGFALAPNPVWFMLILSPDLVFAALVGFFYLTYFRENQTLLSTLTWGILLSLVLLTRPNGYSILLFVLMDVFWSQYRNGGFKIWRMVFLGALALLFALYLYPYFITEMRKSAVDHVFFGQKTSFFVAGIFPLLPDWLDIIFSWSALALAKVLYFVGLRPSYGATPDILVLLRALPGMILLPGLVWGLFYAGVRHRMFLLLYFLPVFLGPSQDRYNLPVYPLLFFFGIHFYQRFWPKFASAS